MATELAERLMSAEEFLLWESEQAFRHELINGRIIEMTGASRSHNRIVFDLARALEDRLYSKGCEVFAVELGVLVDLLGTYTYPDVTVVCGEQRIRAGVPQESLENPTALFEVLSPSTESRDRNHKREQYLHIPSLLGYFLVAQDEPLIEAFTRDGDEWRSSEFRGLVSSLLLPALDCEIPLGEIYRRVSFTGA